MDASVDELKERVMTSHGVAEKGMKELDGMDRIFKKFGDDLINRSMKN